MIPIEDNKRVDWNAIRAEYIGGNISQRKLAAKYNLSPDALMQKANREGWKKDRDVAISKGIAKSQQKSANAIANNATIAAELKTTLLLRLKRIEAKYPLDATEVRTRNGNSTAIFRLRDLTAAYKDLTEDLTSAETDKNAPIYALLKRLDDECGI